MELFLAALGIVFVVASFIVSKVQERNYLRLQERTLERAQETGIYELQAAASDLTKELEEKAAQLMKELEVCYQQLQSSQEPSGKPEPSTSTPEKTALPREPIRSVKSGKPSGQWSERERLVREMNELGMSSEEIAKELGIGKGEVKLILDLSSGEERRYE